MNARPSVTLERPVHERAVLPSLAHKRPVHEPGLNDGAHPHALSGYRLDQDAGQLCAELALCVIEILAGARPLDQVGRWVTDAVFVQLLRRTVIATRSRGVTGEEARRPRVRVGKPMLKHLGDSIVEAVVMIHQPVRSRAVALRLERHQARWRATAITVL